ncbi:FAD/NAD(P)-binding domain-containing protein [Xylariaceae sp. FL0255]|nr:FAD/NAD(P)-binding domain-containing protein [Xylariaceae sp. FL0255]
MANGPNYVSTIFITPFILSHFWFNVLLYILPILRPAPEWSIVQAVRVRIIRLVLFYIARLRLGNKLSLKPGRERGRFEVIEAKSTRLYQGPLHDDAIVPTKVGVTWTPVRPTTVTKDNAIALHFHGGGFVIGDGRDSDTGYVAQTLIKHMGCAYVCTPQYRLSSSKGGQFPAPIQDAVTSYLHLVRDMGVSPSQIVLSGDSAGGNMVVALLRYIGDYGEALDIPSPGGATLWSPWLDVGAALKHDIQSSPNYPTDYLNTDFAQWGASTISAFGAIDVNGPWLSPLHYPFKLRDNIPIFINGGGREVLIDDIKLFFETFAQKAGWNIRLHVSKGGPHDLILLGSRMGFSKEAEAAARDARAILSIPLRPRVEAPNAEAREGPRINSPIYKGATLQFCKMDYDIVIVGAGISGINAAYRIQSQEPNMKYIILEGRDSIGGTWDLFKYPGIRSDSDIFTFGFEWSPWRQAESMAAGPNIKSYVIESAKSAGIDKNIRYRHNVEGADWHSGEQRWVLSVNVPGEEKPKTIRSRFMLLGTGYYDYETPMQTIIPGIEKFEGKVIHPQFWPEDYDYTGKDVVIIGSGATAVTILPSITGRAKRATMLQRSPGYIFSLPTSSFVLKLLFAILPVTLAHTVNRYMWLCRSYISTWFCKAYPEAAKRLIRKVTIKQLPPHIKWDPNFKPSYNPWEQRFCACQDGDFFAALRSGKADVVTDKIKTVTEKSIELESGKALYPDVIVTATGLKLKFGGGIRITLDGGEPVDIGQKFAWKAALLQDVPNLAFLTGYENQSWTLGADVSVFLFLRVLRLMRQREANVVIPKVTGPPMEVKPILNLKSTYVRKAPGILPKAGEGQWSPKTSYFADIAVAKWGDVTTDLKFT